MKDERCRFLLEQVHFGYAWHEIISDAQGNPTDYRVIEANPAFERITGLKARDIVGKTVQEICREVGDIRFDWVNSYGRIAREGGSDGFEHYSEPLGRWFRVEVISDKKGYLAVVLQDITSVKRNEEELHKFKTIFDRSHFGNVLFLPDGTIVYANEAFARMHGTEAMELTGRNLGLLHGKDQLPVVEMMLKRLAREDNVVSEKFFHTEEDGSVIVTMLDASVIRDKDNRLLFYSASVNDITEKQKYEQDLIIAKEKAEESNRFKSYFLAMISHEIRTPMNSILGFLRLLQSIDPGSADHATYYENINRSSQRMLNTINKILDMSQIETGGIPNTIAATELSAVMHYLADFFKPEAQEKGLDFIFSLSPECGSCLMMTDRYKLEAILTNLIKNAIKFTSSGSVEFGCRHEGNTVLFYVRDTGRGIPAGLTDAIYAPFMQVDMEYSREQEGSGLGLPIAKAFAENLGGQIRVESAAGGGSIFYFSLPYHRAGKSGTAAPERVGASASLRAGLLILVAEDDELNYRYLEAVLRNTGASCLRATTGEEAVSAFTENPGISLILMDIKMPGMDGFRAVREIRKIDAAIPVIAQTGFAMPGDRERALAAGCNDYIAKPVKAEELLALISKNLM